MSDITVGSPGLQPPNDELAVSSSPKELKETDKSSSSKETGSAVFTDELTQATTALKTAVVSHCYKTTDLEADTPQVPETSLEEGAPVEEESSSSISSEGKWLTLSAKSIIAENMIEMASTLRQGRVVETKLRINNLVILFDLAEHAAELIKESAKKQSEMYKEQAQAAMIKAIASAASMGIGIGAAKASMAPQGTGPNAFGQAWTTGGMGQALNTTTTSIADMLQYNALAKLNTEKGKIDAEKEIVDGIKSIMQQALQSAFDNDKKLEELLKASLQRAQQIYQQEARAHSTLTQHSV